MNSAIFVLLVFILFLLSTKPCYSLTKPKCPEIERKALLQFKNNSRLSSWVGDDCCAWSPNVYCSDDTGNVIDFSFHQLSEVALDGNVLYPLLSLNYLTHLDLSNNNFIGSQIPKFIGSFKSLQYLDLSRTGFSGRIPDELGNLSSLQQLDLRNKGLFIENVDWISQLKSLHVLDLSYTNMSMVSSSWPQALNTLPYLVDLYLESCELTSIPPLSQVNFTSLQWFRIAYNAINSTLPDWLCMPNLIYLSITNNLVYGSLPASIGNSSSLEFFDIEHNNLDGAIPESIGQLRRLQQLYIGYNAFTGIVSEAHFVNMSRLIYLDLSHNLFILKISDNSIPPFQLYRLAMDYCQVGPQFPSWLKTQHYLELLYMSNAGIKGPIPNWISNFSSNIFSFDLSNNDISGKLSMFSHLNLITLQISNNSFSGPIPLEFGKKMTNLIYLGLSTNDFDGTIPISLFEIKSLTFLLLSNNKIEGDIPNFWKKNSQLQLLKLAGNNLFGKIHSSLCNLTALKVLQLSHNTLSSSIPHCLTNSTSLIEIDLGHNNLTGNIPLWHENNQLAIISLRFNALTGTIPNFFHLKFLRVLYLSNNYLFGHIPLGLGNLSAMAFETTINITYHPYVSIYFDFDALWVISKGMELEFKFDALAFFKSIDLSENKLTGCIPNEFGGLYGLKSLNLSGNHLIGKIPNNIGRLQQLETLDLSRNNLSGAIPLSLETLYFLEILNLSYNNLSGKIPSGGQLQALDNPSIYEGNPYLCGFPLEKLCQSDNKDEVDTDNEEEFTLFYIAIAPGFVVGFWLVCGILILQKKWRIAYFKAVDKVYCMFINNA